MKLNPDKCHLLVVGNKDNGITATVGSENITESDKEKLLGIEIDRELNFKDHVNSLCKKASNKVNALSRLCNYLPFCRRRLLINAFFYSQFSYCPLVWMFCGRKLNTKINNLHHRVLRAVYRDETSSFDESLKKDG